MFVLRQSHLDAFTAAARESFEDRMVAHLESRFPNECEELGDANVRDRIWEGVERAEAYEIRAEKDVATFIRYMFGLRRDFDTSRKTAWAGEILDETDVPATERLARIKEIAREKRSEGEN